MGQEDGWRGEIASIMRERERGMGSGFSKILRSRVCLGRLQIVRACTRASKACVMRALGERALCVREMCAEMGLEGWVGEAR